ncbi:MAG: hypothetical protein AAGU75_15285 [Bacillota bacterium]
MADPISIGISSMALFVSATTLWFTLLRQGRLAMTKPTIVFFGYEGNAPYLKPKIFLRTLLYSTSIRGKIIEGMYLKLKRGGNEKVFSFWGYGEREKLVPGSGLYVGQTGIAANHHFVIAMDDNTYKFEAGDYIIQVFARLVGKKAPLQLSTIQISFLEEHASVLSQRNGMYGVVFELGPDNQGYIGHINERPYA